MPRNKIITDAILQTVLFVKMCMFHNLHYCKHKFTTSHINCHAFRVSSSKVIYVISITIFPRSHIKLIHLFIESKIYFKNQDCPSSSLILYHIIILLWYNNNNIP